MYNLYDDIILLREGRIVYHGPREALPPYMAGIGFAPPSVAPTLSLTREASASASAAQEDVADWLLSVITHPHGAYLKAKAAATAASLASAGPSSSKVRPLALEIALTSASHPVDTSPCLHSSEMIRPSPPPRTRLPRMELCRL